MEKSEKLFMRVETDSVNRTTPDPGRLTVNELMGTQIRQEDKRVSEQACIN